MRYVLGGCRSSLWLVAKWNLEWGVHSHTLERMLMRKSPYIFHFVQTVASV